MRVEDKNGVFIMQGYTDNGYVKSLEARLSGKKVIGSSKVHQELCDLLVEHEGLADRLSAVGNTGMSTYHAVIAKYLRNRLSSMTEGGEGVGMVREVVGDNIEMVYQ